jgi:hypothetical protein
VLSTGKSRRFATRLTVSSAANISPSMRGSGSAPTLHEILRFRKHSGEDSELLFAVIAFVAGAAAGITTYVEKVLVA